MNNASWFIILLKRIKRFLHKGYLSAVDVLARPQKTRIFGAQVDLVPPLRLMDDGPVDYVSFKQNGEEYFDIFVRLCHLQRTDRVLDVGCGIGRKTLPLLTYLDPQLGSYIGIDAFKSHVDWCQQKIQPRYPNFHFHYVDVWSQRYNPAGTIKAVDYIFPFRDGEFDFVIAASVFTHMFMTDVRHYMSEIQRILALGGRGMISFFLLNSKSERLIGEGKSTVPLIYSVEPGCKADNPNRLESAVGHSEDEILEMCARYGIKTRIYYGAWCGRQEFLTYQDVLSLEKIK